ncbi:MAG: nucleotide exchange factor GrpE [Halobacteriovorax sp.]|nr:nucleotide exchange factor GrpE [Halobacteriovorax sp.]
MSETTEPTGTEEEKVETENVETEVLEAEENVAELKPKEEDFKSKFYYLAADMENLRKRHDREREQLIKFGNEKVLSGLLDVIDNLERTTAAIENDEDEKIKNIFVGIDMVRKQFLDCLKNNGLETIESIGKDFDPNFHEALAQQPAPDKREGEVITEYQKGYVLNGRLLRAAKVVVAKND